MTRFLYLSLLIAMWTAISLWLPGCGSSVRDTGLGDIGFGGEGAEIIFVEEGSPNPPPNDFTGQLAETSGDDDSTAADDGSTAADDDDATTDNADDDATADESGA